ncbi:putative Aconitase [Peptoniphilus sp. ING2-D1G]|nr:putative Aconitase [Peptoniphilus sp. ING2-D1G]
MSKIFSCKKISKGLVEGTVVISPEPILFYHTDPKTGEITEKNHPLYGKSVKDKIIIFPGGKGSSVVQAEGLYYFEEKQSSPKAFIVENLDTVLVSCAIIMEIPMVNEVDKDFYESIKDGDKIILNATKEIIRIL